MWREAARLAPQLLISGDLQRYRLGAGGMSLQISGGAPDEGPEEDDR